jgi:hypothetical protein
VARSNFNNPTKRLRELAKMDKRAAKDEKRAKNKTAARAARGAANETAPAAPAPKPANVRSLAAAAFIRRMNKTP